MRLVKTCAFLSGLVLASAVSVASEPVNTATLWLDQPAGQVISRHVYGHFLENLGRAIYDGAWLDDGDSHFRVNEGVAEALRNIHTPNLRWPGGRYAESYHWKDGVGPLSARPRRENVHWGRVGDDNSFGTDEYLAFCGTIECAPTIVGNVQTGTPEELRAWVRYVVDRSNATSHVRASEKAGTQSTADLYVHIGNQAWSYMGADAYVAKFRDFSSALQGVSIAPKLIAVGPGRNDTRWMEAMMRGLPLDKVWGISFHHYVYPEKAAGVKADSATEFGEAEYFDTFIKCAEFESILQDHIAVMDRYDEAKKVALVVGEWGVRLQDKSSDGMGLLFQQNSLRDALAAASILNSFNQHSDRVRMANLAQTVNVVHSLILTQGAQIIRTPTYHVFDLFKVHQDAVSIPFKLESPNYAFEKRALPAVSASASQDIQGVIHLTLVNIDPHQAVSVFSRMAGIEERSVQGAILTSDRFTDVNTFKAPDHVKLRSFTNADIVDGQLVARLPPKSVVLLSLPKAGDDADKAHRQ